MVIRNITDENFQQEVLSHDKPVLVDFWAEWCSPCKALSPVMTELSDEYQGRVKVCKVNTEDNHNLVSKYKISSLPTSIMFKNGEIVNKTIGMNSKKKFQSDIEEALK